MSLLARIFFRTFAFKRLTYFSRLSVLLMKNHFTRQLALFALALFFSTKIAAQNIVISSQVTPSSCFTCNGSIVVTVTGGVPPYNYARSNGATTPTINNLCPGTYKVLVSDASGVAQAGLPIIVSQLTSTFSLTACATAPSCFGGFNGSIDLSVSGGMGDTPIYGQLPLLHRTKAIFLQAPTQQP